MASIKELEVLEEIESGKKYSRTSLYKDAWKRLRKNKLAMLGLAIVILLILIAIFAPLISPYDPIISIKTDSSLGPSVRHFFGTDLLGRDIFSRVIYGSRISIEVGVIAVGISVIIGLFFGALSGYIEAARAMGASNNRIITKHIFPNSFAPIIVYATMNVGTAIIVEAALSFLGIGVQPPTPAWGKMLADSMAYIDTAPWMMFFPGLAILITVLGFVLLGDGLRDAFDPKLK